MLKELVEIKTENETENCSAWISYHSPQTRTGDDYISRFSDSFCKLDKLTQCFVVAIGIQMLDYLKVVNLNHIWFVQENEKYYEAIKKACKYLKNSESIIGAFMSYRFQGCCLIQITI